MTIIAGALWPWWGEAGMPSPPVRGLRPQAAILVCDSRWTMKGGKAGWHEDMGRKMFQIARDAGAVYAGHVEAGEEALNALAARFSKGRVKHNDRPRLARDVFKAVYGRHQTTEPLRILVGHCDPKGFAGLTYFGNENGFEPRPEQGVSVIAWRDSKEAFTDGLADVIKETVWGSPGAGLSPYRPMTSVGAAMYRFVLEPGQDSTVGGRLQLGMAIPEGFKTYALVTNRDPTDDSGWRRITPEPGKLRTWEPRVRKA